MKPLLIVGLITAILISSSVISILHVNRVISEIEAELDSSQKAADSENWEEALSKIGRAREILKAALPSLSFLLRHDELETALDGLVRVEVCVALEDADAMRLETASAALMLEHLKGVNDPSFVNIF